MLLLLLAALLPAPGGLALAQPADTEEEARVLAKEAAKAFRDGDFHVALARFQAANALVPHPTLQVNIGRSFEKLGQWENALDACRAVLAQPALPEATSKAAEECVQRVAPKVVDPTLEVRSAPPGAALMVDGQPKGPTPWKGTVEPGKRQIDVTLPGHRPITREIVAVRGKLESLAVVMVPEAVGGVLAIRTVPPGAALTLDGDARRGEARWRVEGAPPGAVLQLALVEGGLVVAVPRGENAGEKLSHDNVVRVLRTVPLTADTGALTLPVPAKARPENLRLIGFVQDAAGLAVLAADDA